MAGVGVGVSAGQIVILGHDSAGTPIAVLVDAQGHLLSQDAPSSTFAHLSRTTNAGVAVLLHAGQACREVLITAKPGNTGYVYVGGATVSSASYGQRLSAGEGLRAAVNNLNLIYIDVSVNGEGVNILYV